MQALVDATGRRVQMYRPYIDQEEIVSSLTLYDPYVPYHYGLYDHAQPSCMSWQKHFLTQNPQKGPTFSASPKTGVIYSNPELNKGYFAQPRPYGYNLAYH